MAHAQATLTLVRDDGVEVEGTVEVRGSDSQIRDEVSRFMRMLRGPVQCRPCLPVGRKAVGE